MLRFEYFYLLTMCSSSFSQTKCEVYWPRDGTAQKYGVVSVTNTQETIIPTCTIRKFTLAVAHNTKDVSVSGIA